MIDLFQLSRGLPNGLWVGIWIATYMRIIALVIDMLRIPESIAFLYIRFPLSFFEVSSYWSSDWHL